MQARDFETVLDQILTIDRRFHRDAYFFVREALDYTQKLLAKSKRQEIRHVTGQELLGGIRDFALQQFGPMVITVLNEWGITRGEDFGEIVFSLVESNVLAKTESDCREDFKGGYSFEEVFRRPFLPSQPRSLPVSESKPRPSQV